MATPWQGPRAWRAAFWLLAAAVGLLALMPAPPDAASLGWDKLNHLAAFAALAACAVLGWRQAPPLRRVLLLAALLVYGAAIELLQTQVPNRSAEWADLLADALGIAAGAGLAAWWLRRRGDRGSPQSPPPASAYEDRP